MGEMRVWVGDPVGFYIGPAMSYNFVLARSRNYYLPEGTSDAYSNIFLNSFKVLFIPLKKPLICLLKKIGKKGIELFIETYKKFINQVWIQKF
jgi:hypothetical protein